MQPGDDKLKNLAPKIMVVYSVNKKLDLSYNWV